MNISFLTEYCNGKQFLSLVGLGALPKRGEKFTVVTESGEWETVFDPDNPETYPAHVAKVLEEQI